MTVSTWWFDKKETSGQTKEHICNAGFSDSKKLQISHLREVSAFFHFFLNGGTTAKALFDFFKAHKSASVKGLLKPV